MTSFKLFFTWITLTICSSLAFTTISKVSPPSSTKVYMTTGSRRSFFGKFGNAAALVAGGTSLTVNPVHAFGGGKLNKVNAKLVSFGFPAIENLPDGFTPLAEIWGKGKNRSPYFVTFNHPVDWVVVLPSQDLNGEDGTIQVGEYAKGDTASFFVYEEVGKITNLAEQPKEFFNKALIKSISQKGENFYQDFKITKIDPRKGLYKDQDYVIVDFKYQLLTGAGFEVDRTGVASVTNTGDTVQVMWSASTRQRFKKVENQLRGITESFRCYSGGLDEAKLKYEEFN